MLDPRIVAARIQGSALDRHGARAGAESTDASSQGGLAKPAMSIYSQPADRAGANPSGQSAL